MVINAFSRTLQRLTKFAGLLGVVVLSVGCENEPNGFFDPTQPVRMQQEPLIVPIVDNLNIGADEELQQFGAARDVKPDDLVATATDYEVQANDLLSVSITDLVAPGTVTERAIRVTQTGKISLPLLNSPIVVEGMTEQQIESTISDAYRDAQILDRAQVTVSVLEARGRTFSVIGSGVATGLYGIFDKNFRVLDAMVTARGDVQPGSAIDTIYIIRKVDQPDQGEPNAQPGMQPNKTQPGGVDPLAPQSRAVIQPRRSVMLSQDAPDGQIVVIDGKEVPVNQKPENQTTVTSEPGDVLDPATTEPAGKTGDATGGTMGDSGAMAPSEFEFNALEEPTDREVIKIPYDQLKNGELKYNIVIKPGDMIFVPGPQIGEYYMGGAVAGPGAYSLSGRKITLTQAITSARGFSAVGIPWRTELVRRLPGDKQVFVMVNLSKIFAGEEPDIYLKPNDRVTVGTTWWAPFLASVRNGFRFTYGFGFLYDKNFEDEDFGL